MGHKCHETKRFNTTLQYDNQHIYIITLEETGLWGFWLGQSLRRAIQHIIAYAGYETTQDASARHPRNVRADAGVARFFEHTVGCPEGLHNESRHRTDSHDRETNRLYGVLWALMLHLGCRGGC